MNWRWPLPHRVNGRWKHLTSASHSQRRSRPYQQSETMNFQTYPVAVAAACQNACIDKRAGLLAYLQAFSNNLIAVAVRLVPLGPNQRT